MQTPKKLLFIVGIIAVSGLFIRALIPNSYKSEMRVGTANYFPESIDFSEEKAPLQITDVRERLDRELLINANLHSTTTLILKRANRIFPVIEPILAANGVPDDMKYLAVIESGLAHVSSSAGARGIWQFMPDTAKEKGMEVTDAVDERYHLQKSTEAACRYLKTAKEKLGSWTLAAASYNVGMTGIQKQIDAQKVNNYYDLALNEETSRYVFRILALKAIMKNPKQFGFNLYPNDLYAPIPIRIVSVDSTITDLPSFALGQGINYKILKLHNPWLRDKKLPNPTRKKYELEIPTAGY
ncbi:MAG: murein transglycosylase [Flavobacterium sp. BFFFF2]|nr:MAG: murein transglycosylase [Flavobacterium sp. BFFFF2]